MNTYGIPMMFPGQASQYVGMAKDLSMAQGPAQEFLAAVNDTLGMDLLAIMFEGPGETLTETRNAQPAILAHSIAVFLALQERGVRPSLVAGHSLGEFSAAVACGAMAPLDALRTVRKRGELMYASGTTKPGTMAAVLGLNAEAVAEICQQSSGIVVLANHNSPIQVVISGEIAAVTAAGEALLGAGAKRVIPLNVSGAFHSPLLEDAAAEFKAFLSDITLKDPVVPLVANVSALAIESAEALRAGMELQLTSPVLWHDSMAIMAAGVGELGLILEVGPGKVLTNLAKRVYRDVDFMNVDKLVGLDQVISRLQEQEG